MWNRIPSATRALATAAGAGRCCLLATAALIIASAAGRAVHAQTSVEPDIRDAPANAPLVLGELYDAATRDNPRVAAAQALVRAVEARIPSSRRPPDPQLQLGLMNYMLPDLRPMESLGMTQLQVMQMIPVAGKLRLAGRISDAQAGAQRERAADVAWDVRAQVAAVFYDLYRTDRSLEVARVTLRLLQDLRAMAEAMYRVGEARQADVLRAQVEIARMVEDTTRMRTMRVAAAARLNMLLDRPAKALVASPSLPAFPTAVPTLDDMVTEAEAQRPMVRAGTRDVEAAAAAVQLARSQVWPDITVGAQYGQRGGAAGTERMGSLMVGVAVPIHARSRQLRMRDEAAAMEAMARADLAAMRADTRGRVAEVHANLTRARSLIALYTTTVLPQAEAAVASALSAYRVGSVDFMTVLDNQMMVNAYRQELFALETDQGQAWAALEMLVGRELFDANRLAASDGAARGQVR